MHSTEYENNNDCIVMRTLTLKSGFEFHSESKNFHLIFNWFIFKPWKKNKENPKTFLQSQHNILRDFPPSAAFFLFTP